MASIRLGAMYSKEEYIPLHIDHDDNSCGTFLKVESPPPDKRFAISINVRLVPVINEDRTRRLEDREREAVQSDVVPGYGLDMFAGVNLHRPISSGLHNDRGPFRQSQTQTSRYSI